MYLYQYILLAGFSCLFFRRETRYSAAAFLIGWFVYIALILGLSEINYYALSATVELCIAYALNKRHRIVSYIGYSLVLFNCAGFLSHWLYINFVGFDLIYALLSTTQFLFLLARATPNGIGKLHSKHIVVRCLNYDSGQAYDKMYTNTPTSKKNQCQAK